MQHRHPNLRPATARRLFAWLTACFLGLTLAACGGGSGGDNPTANDGTGGTVSAPGNDGAARPGTLMSAGGNDVAAAKSGTFIAAAGPLCAQRNANGNCIQPTSSSITAEELVKRITDPRGDVIDFDGIGTIYHSILSLHPPDSGEDHPGELRTPSYGMARRHIQAGRNTFTIDGRYYPNAKDLPTTSHKRVINYSNDRSDDHAAFYIHPKAAPDDADDFGLGLHDVWESQSISKHEGASHKRYEVSEWHASMARLTDETDAPEPDTPQSEKVSYVGLATVITGSNEWLSKGTTDDLSPSLGYEAVLNTATGQLTGVSVDYTNPESLIRVRLELPDLRFVNSRLDGFSRQHRIRVRAEGPGDDSSSSPPGPDIPYVWHDFTVDGLEGEIFGKGAYIRIVGGGPGGLLHVWLTPKKLAGDEFVNNVPMTKP